MWERPTWNCESVLYTVLTIRSVLCVLLCVLNVVRRLSPGCEVIERLSELTQNPKTRECALVIFYYLRYVTGTSQVEL